MRRIRDSRYDRWIKFMRAELKKETALERSENLKKKESKISDFSTKISHKNSKENIDARD